MAIKIHVDIGQKIREWTIIEIDNSYHKKRGRYYICECKCGRRLSKMMDALIRIGPQQCKSCATKSRGFTKFGMKPLQLQGKVFGKWTVLERVDNEKPGYYWKCLCECGNICEVFGPELKRGKSTKCVNCVDHNTSGSHGQATKGTITTEYRAWAAIKNRCFNEDSKGFERWGGRGIKVHPEWIDSFEKFYEYMGPKPYKNYSIDRIDNDGNYEPGNVRWASPKQQANNRGQYNRRNRKK